MNKSINTNMIVIAAIMFAVLAMISTNAAMAITQNHNGVSHNGARGHDANGSNGSNGGIGGAGGAGGVGGDGGSNCVGSSC